MFRFNYSDSVVALFDNPQHIGVYPIDDNDVLTGSAGTLASGDIVQIQLKIINQGVVEDCVFKCYGCPATIAASDWVCGWLKGKTLIQADKLQALDVIAALDISDKKAHCALLVIHALEKAVAKQD